VGFSPRKVNDQHTRDAIANGQFIMIRRTVYDAIGGHEKVKDQIVEDKSHPQSSQVERLSSRRRGRITSHPHTHVHIPAQHVGRLDKEYLSRLA